MRLLERNILDRMVRFKLHSDMYLDSLNHRKLMNKVHQTHHLRKLYIQRQRLHVSLEVQSTQYLSRWYLQLVSDLQAPMGDLQK